jgi:hypothetical protein
MPIDQTTFPTLNDHLAEPLGVGDPDVHGPLAVFPVYGPDPVLEYVSFAQGRTRGVTIKEVEGLASVNDLHVLNSSDQAVLLYEGEEVLGAQQNRTFDVSVLVGARSEVGVPVSCVEHGRWDGSRHGEGFAPAPQAAYPALRRMKNRQATVRAVAGGEIRAMQSAVWDEVAEKAGRMSVDSDTDAMHDIFEGRRDSLDEFHAAVRLHDGQTGALVAIGGKMTVLDHVSRPDVFVALHGPLLHGYALDALEADVDTVPSVEDASAFLARILSSRVSQRDGVGLGRDVRFSEPGLGGAGLVAADELVQLTAFADDGNPGAELTAGERARIRRPSRRRAA